MSEEVDVPIVEARGSDRQSRYERLRSGMRDDAPRHRQKRAPRHRQKRKVRFQFTSRHLFGFVALIAVCSAFVASPFRLELVIAVILASVAAAVVGVCTRRRGWMVSGIAVAVVIGIILAVDMYSIGGWRGSYSLTFNVTVQDAETGAPIAGAEVVDALRVDYDPASNHFKPIGPRYAVDGIGNVVFTERTETGGTFSLFGITHPDDSGSRRISLDDEFLRIEAPGYETAIVSVSDACGETEWPMRSRNLPPITIKLVRQGSIAPQPD